MSYDKKDGIETLKYSDVSMKADQYIIQVWPTNFFSSTPSARLQEVQELAQAGLIPPEATKDLMDFPDLEKYTTLDLSGYRLAEKQIETMLETGEYIPPEETDNIQAAKSLCIKYIARQKLFEDSEESIELLRRFLDDLENIEKIVAAASAPPAAAPLAQPEAAPTSDLLPNAPAAPASPPMPAM